MASAHAAAGLMIEFRGLELEGKNSCCGSLMLLRPFQNEKSAGTRYLAVGSNYRDAKLLKRPDPNPEA